MKLPFLNEIEVPEKKAPGYVLSTAHPSGRHKGAFFRSFGFSPAKWKVLASALVSHAADNEITKAQDSPFGKRYIIEGRLVAPDGRRPVIRSVWFLKAAEDIPRFVTACLSAGEEEQCFMNWTVWSW